MANSDGFSQEEIVSILFKNYMGFPSLKFSSDFYQETQILNNTNFLGADIMTDTPTKNPGYTTLNNNEGDRAKVLNKLTSNSSGLVINDNWIETKMTAGATFLEDTNDDSILRFQSLKLDWIGLNRAAFFCKDLCDNNILKNLIPFSYATSGYSLQLEYTDSSTSEKTVANWLGSQPSKEWGVPLFDTKNGVVTFYDVNDDDNPMNVFDISKNTDAPTFYLTATKYVGAFGVGSNTGTTVSGGVWDQDAGTLDISYGEGNVIIEKNLDVNGELDVSAATVQNRLDVMGDVSLNGRVDISGSFYVNGVEISGNAGGGGGSWNNTGNNTTTGDLSVGGNLAVTGNITLGGNDIATKFYVDNKVANTSVEGGSSGGGGGTVSIETSQLGISTILASDPLDLSAGYKSHHKSNQPPAFEYFDSSQENAVNSQSSSITVKWADFAKKFIDAFTGRAFPLSFQTYVDISYTNFGTGSDSDISNTDGWKTIFIGKGTYDGSGARVNPDLSFVIPNNATTTVYTDNTGGLGIPFTGKVTQDDTFAIPPFTQSDTFDLRVYPVNQSQETPNYLIYTGISLKSTNKPGPVTIINFDPVGSASIQMDFSFDLDNLDPTSSGIPMKSYDISYNQVATRSLASGYSMHSNLSTNINVESDANPKDDIAITGLYPGAQYEIQVSAQNSLATGLPFGDYGDPSNSEFTQIQADKYITATTTETNSLRFNLVNSNSVTTHLGTITLLNANGSINVTGTARFLVNEHKQGKSMKEDADTGTPTTLATATISKKVNGSTGESISFAYKSVTNPGTSSVSPSSDTILSVTLSDGSDDDYTFAPSTAYTETQSDPEKLGFVYEATFGLNGSPTNASSVFFNSFPSSTHPYEFRYDVVDQNGSALVQTNNTTGTFYVDNYNSTPTITIPTTITFSASSIVYICGIPSVNQVKLVTNDATIADFADDIIPRNGTTHSFFNITSTPTTFFNSTVTAGTNISSTSSYTKSLTTTKNTSGSMNTTAGTGTVNVEVYHLTQSSNQSSRTSTTSTNISFSYNKIFRDNGLNGTQSYGGRDTLYHFNGNGTIGSSYDPMVNNVSNVIASDQLIYFDGKIRSGAYTRAGLSPFQDWSDGYQVAGPNYNNTVTTTSGTAFNSTTYKWIAFEFTNLTLAGYQHVSSTGVTSAITDKSSAARGTEFVSYVAAKYGGSTTYFGRMDKGFNSADTAWYSPVTNAQTIGTVSATQGVYDSDAGRISFDDGSSPTYYLIIGLSNDYSSYINVPSGDLI
jgi:hypothetical protein